MPGAGRDRPGSSTAPPRQNAKKKKYGAALDPTHHQRGCHPARRSNPSAPRQGIKTASASRKIGRESSTLTYPTEGRRRQVPAAIDPVARRRRRAKTLKRKFTAPNLDVVWRGARTPERARDNDFRCLNPLNRPDWARWHSP